METLNKTLSKSYNPNSDKFRQIIGCLPLSKLKQLGIGPHIEAAGIKRCRQFSFELIQLFESHNPRTNYSSLFISVKMKACYVFWKERQASIEQILPIAQENRTIPANNVESAYKVFAQPVLASDLKKKRSVFVQEAESYFKEEKANQEQVLLKINVENCDMAALRCSFTLETSQDSTGNNDKDIQTNNPGHKRPRVYSEDEQYEPSFNSLLKKRIKASIIPSSDLVTILPTKHEITEVKINHRNTIFVLKLKKKVPLAYPALRGVLEQLDFYSVETALLIKDEPMETSLDIIVLSGRKLSLGCNCHENLLSEICCGSTSSTTAGSELALAKCPGNEVHCNLEGAVTISEDTSVRFNPVGLKSYTMNLFVMATDKMSRSFIQAMPELRHAVKDLFLQTLFLTSKE